MKRLLYSALLLLASCGSAAEDPYRFDGAITQPVLERYLSRAVTMSEFLTVDPFCNDGTYPDKEADVELIRSTGAKFIGRAIYRWGDEPALADPAFWSGARALIDRVHAFDPDVIFQAATFEAVYRTVNEIEVPAWTFEALGLPVEKRRFDYASMLNREGIYVDLWGPGGSVPDITQVETQLWLMYLIGSYVDIGCEAVHLGQVWLMGMNDSGWQTWDSFLRKVRAWVGQRARRHFVLFWWASGACSTSTPSRCGSRRWRGGPWSACSKRTTSMPSTARAPHAWSRAAGTAMGCPIWSSSTTSA